MKKIALWVSAAVFVVSLLFPNGLPIDLRFGPKVDDKPVVAAPVRVLGEVDPAIVSILASATPEDRGRIVSVYDGLRFVINRDAGARINTTEKWAELQANTLQLAITVVGKYPGLDNAIESVFAAKVGSDAVISLTPETVLQLTKACAVIADSALTLPPKPIENK